MGMPAEQVPGPGQVPGTEQQPGQGGAPQEQQSPYSLQAEFLKDVPQETQALLTPYIKKWDGLVTKKFQEVHSQYEPYKQLGEPATIQQAMAIYQALDENPQVIYNLLKQELEGAGPGEQQQLAPGQQPPVGEPPEAEFGLPPEFMERYGRVETMIGQLAELFLNNSKQQQEASEDAQFDTYLSGLKQSHGDFDEDWVTLQISRGMDGEEAVQAWQQKAQEIINAQGGGNGEGQRPSPPVLGGGGNVPTEQVNIGNIPRKDLKSLVKGMLEQGG